MASHHYLELNDVGRRELVTEGQVLDDLILLPLRNVVLFPNESLPLRLRNPHYITAIAGMLETSPLLHLGIVNLGDYSPIRDGFVGTSAEIRAVSAGASSSAAHEIVLRAKGRHRFALLERPRRVDGVYVAKVLILNETLPRSAQGATPSRALPFPSWAYRQMGVTALLATALDLFNSTHSFKSSSSDGSDDANAHATAARWSSPGHHARAGAAAAPGGADGAGAESEEGDIMDEPGVGERTVLPRSWSFSLARAVFGGGSSASSADGGAGASSSSSSGSSGGGGGGGADADGSSALTFDLCDPVAATYYLAANTPLQVRPQPLSSPCPALF
jgi:hypothetical protein